MKATLSGREERTIMKIVVDAATDRVVGVHILGEDAGEMAQLLGIAVKLKARKCDFDATMALHPSAAEELVTMRTPDGALAGLISRRGPQPTEQPPVDRREPAPMKAIPRRCCGFSASPSTTTPSRMALTGIKNVTSIRFVAPALERIWKKRM